MKLDLNIIFYVFCCLGLITSCSKDNTSSDKLPPLGTINYYENVKFLGSKTSGQLIMLDSSSLTFNNNFDVKGINVGDIIIGDTSVLAPSGFARKVTSISTDGKINTQFCSLGEIIKSCNIKEKISFDNWTRSPEISFSLNKLLYDGDKNESTTNDQVILNGEAKINPDYIFEIQKEEGSDFNFKYIKIGIEFDGSMAANVNCTGGIEDKYETLIYTFKTKPINIYGIIIKPVWKVFGGIEGKIGAQLNFGSKFEFANSIYREYENGNWDTIQSKQINSPLAPYYEVKASGNISIYLRSASEIQLWGVVASGISTKTSLISESEYDPLEINKVNYCFKYKVDAGLFIESLVFDKIIPRFDLIVTLIESKIPKIGSFEPCGKITLTNESEIEDIDGNKYNSIKIGNQEWLTENLKVTRYNNGDPIDKVLNIPTFINLTNKGAFCFYDNDESNKDKLGCMYNYWAAKDSRKICPLGWHVPSNIEWQELSDYLGDGAGTKMKSKEEWNGNNLSGFNSLPSGVLDGYFLSNNKFSGLGGEATYWATTNSCSIERDVDSAWLRSNETKLTIWCSYYTNNSAMCIRCLKD